MAEGAVIASEYGAKIIDINMGCPVPKVVKNGEGSTLMQNPPLACDRKCHEKSRQNPYHG